MISPTERFEIKELLKENINLSRLLLADTKKIRRYMMWRMIFNIIWLIIVIVPIILTIIYLPPALQSIYGQYQDMVGQGQGAMELLNQLKGLK